MVLAQLQCKYFTEIIFLRQSLTVDFGVQAWVKLITVLELYLLFCNVYPNIIHQPMLSFLSVTPTTLTNLTNVPPTFVLGCTLLAAGASLRGLCYWYLGKNFTFQLALRKGHTLCTGGPYSIVRHPSYTGIVLCLLGHTLCMLGPGSWWAESHVYHTSLGKFVAVLWITMVCLLLGMAFTRVSKEDIIMKDAFGSQWVEWANRTPYAMIPLLY